MRSDWIFAAPAGGKSSRGCAKPGAPICREGSSFAWANLAIPAERALGTGRGEIDPQKQQNCEGFCEMGHHGVSPKAGTASGKPLT